MKQFWEIVEDIIDEEDLELLTAEYIRLRFMGYKPGKILREYRLEEIDVLKPPYLN